MSFRGGRTRFKTVAVEISSTKSEPHRRDPWKLVQAGHVFILSPNLRNVMSVIGIMCEYLIIILYVNNYVT